MGERWKGIGIEERKKRSDFAAFRTFLVGDFLEEDEDDDDVRRGK